jgi:hypothetical protein
LLHEEAKEIFAKVSPNGTGKIDEKCIFELVRYADSRLHTVAAFLGGAAS